MKILENILSCISYKIIFTKFILILYTFNINAAENGIEFVISGNQNTDEEVVMSILGDIPANINQDYSNYLLDELNNTNLFKDIKINIIDSKIFIDVVEYPVIQQIYFEGNERFKNEELSLLADQLNFEIYNDDNIKNFIFELKNAYSSFGYNNVKVDLEDKINDNNLVNLYINIKENNITKIKSIKFKGNSKISNSELNEAIKSKVKKLTNIFANNNFKPTQVDVDRQRLIRLYKNKGFADIKIDYEVEFSDINSVTLYFYINEGNFYQIENVSFSNYYNNETIENLLNEYFLNNKYKEETYNATVAESIEENISSILKNAGIQFFEINKLVKLNDSKASLLFEVKESKPIYVNNININGNTRTLDYVIRRELELVEGDAFQINQVNIINNKLQSLGFFEKTDVTHKFIGENLVDIEINISENQTGSFTAGASFGSLDGITFVTGLNESNIGGTGRSLEFMINNSENNSQYKLHTTDKFFLKKNMDLSFGLDYSEKDFSKSSSYQLDQYQITSGLSYKFQENIFHSITLNYELDSIFITDTSTASSTIKDVQGGSVKFILENALTYSTLNSFLFPRNGNYLRFVNAVETPTSSKNGYIKNTINFRKFIEINRDIFSFQAKIGNIFSLKNSDILPDDKYSLGGKWLRGFDNFGVGPRNSRTSYIGGNNILASKLDYSKLLLKNDDNPIYFNLFNDIGLLWGNKTAPTFKDETLRSSAGFGIKFYSFIGPIAFTWGFPVQDETYDIKRMFTFSIGNIN